MLNADENLTWTEQLYEQHIDACTRHGYCLEFCGFTAFCHQSFDLTNL